MKDNETVQSRLQLARKVKAAVPRRHPAHPFSLPFSHRRMAQDRFDRRVPPAQAQVWPGPKAGAAWNGAPARTRSHYQAILQLLRERDEQGILGSELYARPELYGRSPRNRISELRRDGHSIEGRAHGASDWWYRLIRDNAGAKPLSDSPDWFVRQTGKPRPSSGRPQDQNTDLPLFAAVRQ